MIHDIVDGLAYGGDYNPEQWPEEVWTEDMRLMKEAGVNLVSLGIFSWARLQPEEGVFDFTWLDRIMDMLNANGIRADLATATAAQPNWMSLKYSDVMAVDEQGIRYSWGSRQAYCPNSPSYRSAAALMVKQLALRYAAHPALAMWHVNNEYACHVASCYCGTCAAEFRGWLSARYGDLATLNKAWGTSFWSQGYGKWEEVMPPRYTTTFKNPSQELDYRRFMSDSLLSLYTAERDILRSVTPEKKITTNFMMHFKPVDYWKWAKELDIISWDSYPDPLNPAAPETNAFDHDLMRSLGSGRPFMLMEQAAGRVNWREVNGTKPPGLMRYHSMQAVAHGADAVMFFQWRQSRGGSEQFHSGMLPHSGERSRIFTEIRNLGAELRALAPLAGSRIEARAGFFVDYDSWWYSEMPTSPTAAIPYWDELMAWYRPFRERNIALDMVCRDTDLGRYSLLVMPRLFVLPDYLAEKLETWVKHGGVLLVTGGSAWVDQTGAIHSGGAPGPLRSLLGLTVDDLDPVPTGTSFGLDFGDGQELEASLWREEIIIEGAKVLAVHSGGPYDGHAAATVNQVGRGEVRYVSVRPGPDAMARLVEPALGAAGIKPVMETPAGVLATRRIGDDGRRWIFLMREGVGDVTVPLSGKAYRRVSDGIEIDTAVTLSSWGVEALEELER